MKTRQRCLIALVTVAFVTAATAVAPACFMRAPLPVQVWLDHIEVDITDQVAVKTYRCSFKNPNPQAVVGGTCYMELEPGSQVDNMSVTIDGKETQAEILDLEKAKQVFTDIVKNGGSPALLEYFGNELIQTQVPRIPPNGVVHVKLTYTTVLKRKDGLVRLQMLNTNPKALMQPLKSASVTVNIRSTEPLKNIYSPTHKIKLVEKKGWDVSAEWSQDEYMPKHPFVLYYQVAQDKVGAGLVAHREPGQDGAFMLMLSPTLGAGAGHLTEADVLPKDVVFCVDTSGSMLEGKKMEQARAALKYCVEHLRPGDRFNIVDFSTVARTFREKGLADVSDENRAAALRYVENLRPRGGTAIQEALETSLDLLGDSDRLKMILFATDGLPTIGERNPEALLKRVSNKNTRDVRLFVFGEGFDVNTRLLDFLALKNRGEADYILPEEDIEKKIAGFFDRVGAPIMTDLKIEFDGVGAEDVFPRHVKDVYRGEQVILFGRYKSSGMHTVRLSGYVNGARKTFEYHLNFPAETPDDRAAFVPRLWAGQKIDYLLNEIRDQANPDKELVEEITELAKRYGIVTPYTSYLMADDMIMRDKSEAAGQLQQAFRSRGFFGPASTQPAAQASPQAVSEAKKLADLRRQSGSSGAANAYDQAADLEGERLGGKEDGAKHASLTTVRYIGSRTFYKSGDTWHESDYSPKTVKDADVTDVRVGSDEYVKLLLDNPRIAKYLALGKVILKVNNKWYRCLPQEAKG
jgi:Ca-activated chloride channel family protein